MQRSSIPAFVAFLVILGSIGGAPAGAQMPSHVPNNDPEANFPPIPTLSMYATVDTFKAEIEGDIGGMRARQGSGKAVVALVDTLISAFDRYGVYMDRTYGDFPNMSRGRPYWLIATDNAADTLTDRAGNVIEAYVKANPNEILGAARAKWELEADKLGVPRSRIFGFQFVELARRAALLRRELVRANPTEVTAIDDANIRFLWDLVQFYRQLHATWYDRHVMRVADEDWIVHRTTGRCKDPKWQVAVSMTAIGVDTTNYDPMTDKFMHRLKIIDPGCPDTIDFVVSLPHYRLMEKELSKLTPAEKDSLLRRTERQAEKKAGAPSPPQPGAQLRGSKPPEEKH